MRSNAVLIVYTFVTHLQGRNVYFWTNKLYGSSGQLCGLDSGKCWIRAIGNLAPSLNGVIIFLNTFYVSESTYTCLLSFSHRTPCLKPRKNGTFGSDLLQSLQFLFFHKWEMVASYWIRPLDSKFESLIRDTQSEVTELAQSTGRLDPSITILCTQNAKFWKLNMVVHIVTTVLQRKNIHLALLFSTSCTSQV